MKLINTNLRWLKHDGYLLHFVTFCYVVGSWIPSPCWPGAWLVQLMTTLLSAGCPSPPGRESCTAHQGLDWTIAIEASTHQQWWRKLPRMPGAWNCLELFGTVWSLWLQQLLVLKCRKQNKSTRYSSYRNLFGQVLQTWHVERKEKVNRFPEAKFTSNFK